MDLAIAYTVFPTAGRPPEALWRRIRPADTTCFEPTPALLNRAYPDFAVIMGEEGRPCGAWWRTTLLQTASR
ncbi:hypothetical protein ABC969_07570 [Sphingomonas qilianensis]|uniref:Uncharacterized protein n=1 Tax=Sphingomonas qilianensis TaxID=1736690 RepID=A0ABU9XR23_9SPHN